MIVKSIVVTYNGKRWLERCLGSLLASDYITQVIVVDNASTDGTQEFIIESFPEVNLIQSEENLGFGKANNIGIRKAYDAGADYIFLLNQDAWITDNTIKSLVDAAMNNPEYGIISPIHLNGEGSKLDNNFYRYVTKYKYGSREMYSDIFLGHPKEVYEFPFINAASWLISRKCIEKVGGFDPIFSHYGEDPNYCNRAIYHNFKIGVSPKSIIYHDRENREPNTSKEFRVKLKKSRLLVNLTNITSPFSLSTELLKLCAIILMNITSLQLSKIKENIHLIIYLFKMKRKILHSRRLGMNLGLTYLSV